MKVKEAFPNLNFVGPGSKEFAEIELTEEELKIAREAGQRGKEFGLKFRAMAEQQATTQ